MTAKVRALGPFPNGVNNVAKETELRGSELRDAVNVLLTDEGWPRTRSGFSQVYAGTNTHSLVEPNGYYLVVDNGNLCRFYPGDATLITLQALDDALSPMSYCEVDGEVYCTNGTDFLRLVGRAPGVRPAALPVPTVPTLSAGAGSLPAGTYTLVAVFIAPDGVESGTSPAVSITLAGSQSLQIDSVPQPPAGYVADTLLFVTEPNGKRLLQTALVPMGVTSWVFNSGITYGREVETLHMVPLKPGRIVRAYAGRLFTADGPVLRVSQPLRYGLTLEQDDYLMFPEDITVIQPVGDGVYVVADKAYFLKGRDFATMTQDEVHLSRATFGTGLDVDGSKFGFEQPLSKEAAYWYSEKGGVVAGDGGRVEPYMEGRAEDAKYASGGSYFSETDGIRQVGTVLSNQGPQSRLRASDSATAVVRRNGVIVG